MLSLPLDVIGDCILPCLKPSDLQALHNAYTNKELICRLRNMWKSFRYVVNCKSFVVLKWIHSIGVEVVGIIMYLKSEEEADSFLSFVIEHLSALKVFELDAPGFNNAILTDNFLLLLAKKNTLLEKFHVSNVFEAVSDAGVIAFAQNSPQLREIKLRGSRISDYVIDAFCTHCPNLQHIALEDCGNLTDGCLAAIGNSYPMLQSLILESNNFTDDGIASLTRGCHELRAVVMYCSEFTDDGLSLLWAANPHIREVDIGMCEITDVAIISLAHHCPRLQSLELFLCGDFTSATRCALLHCPELTKLNICNSNTDYGEDDDSNIYEDETEMYGDGDYYDAYSDCDDIDEDDTFM